MRTKDLTAGGLLCALTIVLLYMTYLLPHNTLTLLTLASFMVPLALIRSHIGTAFLVYICSTLLSMFLLPPKIFMMYSFFFGNYGLVKYYIERLDKPFFEWVLKFIYFNIILTFGLHTFMTLISPQLFSQLSQIMTQILPNFPLVDRLIFFLIAQVAFFIFDYALTLLIDTYYRYFP